MLPLLIAEAALSAKCTTFKALYAKYPALSDYQLLRLLIFVQFLRNIGKGTTYDYIKRYITMYARRERYLHHVQLLEDAGLITVVRTGIQKRIRAIYLSTAGHDALKLANQCFEDFPIITRQRKQRKERIYRIKRK